MLAGENAESARIADSHEPPKFSSDFRDFAGLLHFIACALTPRGSIPANIESDLYRWTSSTGVFCHIMDTLSMQT